LPSRRCIVGDVAEADDEIDVQALGVVGQPLRHIAKDMVLRSIRGVILGIRQRSDRKRVRAGGIDTDIVGHRGAIGSRRGDDEIGIAEVERAHRQHTVDDLR
jgi:hypothetical protein